MRGNWLETRFGINFTGIGLLAVCVAAPLLVFHDVWFVLVRKTPEMWLYDRVLLYTLAFIASVFSAANVYFFRSGLPKYVAAILAASFASYVVQPVLPIHDTPQISMLCVSRILGISTLLLLVRSYVLDLKAGKVAR